MIRSIKQLQRFRILAADGALGSVDDFFFDDDWWAVRYLVVDTGAWLPGRRVLISPAVIDRPDWIGQTLSLSLTQQQVKDSPDIDTHKPVSRRAEAAYAEYFGYPQYWAGGFLWGPGPYASAMTRRDTAAIDARRHREEQIAEAQGDQNLRSTREVTGYHLHATDGELGHVEDFLVDDDSWAMRYLVVDTSNWWIGRHVLIPLDWIVEMDWVERRVAVDVDRQSVKSAPSYDAATHIDRQWEADYYAHYRRPGYWITPEAARKIKRAQSYLRDGSSEAT